MWIFGSFRFGIKSKYHHNFVFRFITEKMKSWVNWDGDILRWFPAYFRGLKMFNKLYFLSSLFLDQW